MEFTIEDIKRITEAKEKETLHIELKSFRKIIDFNDKNKKDIACEIIAFANRQGGKLIFGINDDGTKDHDLEICIDKLKETLHNLCFDNISPVVECGIQFIDESEGKYLILYIPKRTGIPHAYIEKRSNSDIKSRTYYIRTSHGKKLVTDGQLQWLFQNSGEPKYEYQFRIGFEFTKQMDMIGDIVPWGNYEFTYFRGLLNTGDLSIVLKESKNFAALLTGLMPYMILKSLYGYFKNSWHIGIRKGFDRMSSGPMITDTPLSSTSIHIHEIPVKGESFVHQLSWDFQQILKELLPDSIHLPPGTSIEIIYAKENTSSTIIFSNPAFTIELITGMLSGGAGLHQRGLLHNLLFERYPVEEQQKSLFRFLHYDAAGHLNASFNYPEYDMNEFERYLGFYNSLKELLGYNWDFDTKRMEHPTKEMLVMDDKLNEILGILKRPPND